MRSSAWVHPRRRHRRRLGACEVTWHAVDSYLTRVPGARRSGAHDALKRLAAGAQLSGRTATGEELYDAGPVRLVVWRSAKRPPVLVTVYFTGGNGD